MIETIGGRIDIKHASGSQYARGFKESQPEHGIVLEARGRYNQLKMIVRKGITVGIIENTIHASSGRKVDTDVFEVSRTYVPQRTIDVQGANIQYALKRRFDVCFKEHPP